MKPVIVFRHACCEGAGYLGHFLTARHIPWFEFRLDIHQDVPADVTAYSGIVLMGGPMSVNDDLPWIAPLLALIQSAFQQDIPVMGHCLGGQLMSKALGASVTVNPVKEIGWGKVDVSKNPLAKQWFGDVDHFLSFHWHSETFAVPDGATHLLSSVYCQNQGYVMGKHLAMQCHIEVTEAMIALWCDIWLPDALKAGKSDSIQTADAIFANITQRVAALNMQAHYTYSHWAKGLVA